MKKYGFRDWDSVLAALGHGGLKEGQVINKLQDAYRKKNPQFATDKDILEAVGKIMHHPMVRREQWQRSSPRVVL